MSQPRSDNLGSKVRPRLALPPEEASVEPLDDALGGSLEPTDDTPTIISRHAPRPGPGTLDENFGSLRGRRLAHFELIEPIGVGGMAAVLRARDTQLDRIVALKILPPEMAADPENVRRFHQEARSAAKLDHENIARVFFCGEDQRLHFIAFEFVEGDNLRTILERRARLPVGEALHYVLQVSAGLAHASRRGVVHRDIKPSNIIITPNGRAKLVDMGLARSLGPQAEADLTQSGVTLGTFDYISPEQALEPRDADVRSDIYSLGCTFYHVLTGRPPVPEGTAAKKLHHHQHVKPIDPRHLVPGLPDDVAVVLDRMIAKQPKDRYSSPELLVHDLYIAAKKIGAVPEVGDGLLSVEAELPTRPVGRPFLLAGLAVAAVVGLILVLGQTAGPAPRNALPGAPNEGDATARAVRAGPPGSFVPTPREGPRPPLVQPGKGVAVYKSPEDRSQRTLAHLLDWLHHNRGAERIELHLAGDLDLSGPRESEGMERDGAELGVHVRARNVIIKPLTGEKAPTLRFTYDGKDSRPRVALTILSDESTVSGVRFVVDALASDTAMAGLLVRGGRKHRVEGCEFIQARPSFKDEEKGRLASVVIEAGGLRPELTLSECCFLGFGSLEGGPSELVLKGVDPGGQDAVVRRGPAFVTAESCAFGPHSSVFRLESGTGEGEEAVVLNVRDCSVLGARRSTVFDVPAGARAKIDVARSLISRWGETGGGGAVEGGSAVLVRQAEAGNAVTYRGHGNRYHNLDGYWAVGDGWQEATWRAHQRKVGGGDDSRVLVSHPWKVPSDWQIGLLEQRKAQAFALNEQLSALRTVDGLAERLVGVQGLLKGRVAPLRLAPVDEKAEARVRRYLVVGAGEGDSLNGTYAGLPEAVLAARAGDVLLVRQDGQVKVDSIALNKKGMGDLTIRPYRYHRPVLTLGDATETEAALFRLHDGKLRLEGLEFRLKPLREGFKSQVVVALVGNGDCAMKDCVVTLDRGGQDANLAVATLAEVGKAMKMDTTPARTPEQGPCLTLDGCFVRGEGDLLWGRAGRPGQFDAKGSLVALSGSLYNVEVPEDAAPVGPNLSVVLNLTRTTTYLGGHLLRLGAGKDLKGLVPIDCKPVGSLFLPATSGRTLVHLDGPETEEKALGEKLKWVGEKNAYGAFTWAFDQQPRGDEMAMGRPMTMETWKRFTREETTSQFGVKLDAVPPAEPAYARLLPSQFVLPATLKGVGADLPALAKLPRRPVEAPR